MDIKGKLHVHIWDVNAPDADPIDCVEADFTDAYPNMSTDPKYGNDGYIQFGADLANGDWIELRIPFDMIPELPGVVEACQAHWDKETSDQG